MTLALSLPLFKKYLSYLSPYLGTLGILKIRGGRESSRASPTASPA